MTMSNDDGERDAYNAAFYELGLRWHWDSDTYDRLVQSSAVASERVRVYLQTAQPHLLKAYDAEFLISAIEAKAGQHRGQAPAHAHRCNWAALQAAQIGA
jgi:hypothetical protein